MADAPTGLQVLVYCKASRPPDGKEVDDDVDGLTNPFSKVLYVLFPVAALAAPFQTFKVPTMDPNTVAPEVPAIDRRVPQEDTCTE
ncbi:hypothetical protein CSOJ01_08423 [Colletotrichum sojae]|uniref:Uncharacterized protein n=1 Tax=Colletotrichum sojae TaxID=2175907 RepID=A0A8H6MSX1_9PEZI|nr:hypothetical protein CSOJ01_08423 [Colletotrichum sojae]